MKIKKIDNPEIEKALRENNGYCPCKIEQNPDTKCMCKEFREQKSGVCTCGLYEKIDK